MKPVTSAAWTNFNNLGAGTAAPCGPKSDPEYEYPGESIVSLTKAAKQQSSKVTKQQSNKEFQM